MSPAFVIRRPARTMDDTMCLRLCTRFHRMEQGYHKALSTCGHRRLSSERPLSTPQALYIDMQSQSPQYLSFNADALVFPVLAHWSCAGARSPTSSFFVHASLRQGARRILARSPAHLQWISRCTRPERRWTEWRKRRKGKTSWLDQGVCLEPIYRKIQLTGWEFCGAIPGENTESDFNLTYMILVNQEMALESREPCSEIWGENRSCS